jgi:peroxiredoxin
MQEKWFAALIACVALVFAPLAHALLAVGDVAPDFTAQAALGGKPFTFSLSSAFKKGPVVLYFYPKVFTSGCTVEAHLFAEASEQFSALGATVIGVSADEIDAVQKFSVEECRNKFAVAADPEGKIIKSYDAKLMFGTNVSKRVSYVVTPDSKVVYVYDSMDPKEHVKRTLEAVKTWQANAAAKPKP